jgi:hypothetical protein
MKAILTTSMGCSAVSLLGLLGVSAMSVAPGAEVLRWGMVLTVGVFFVGWLVLALWARRRLRLARDAVISSGLRTAVLTAGIVYVLLVLLCSFG